MLVTGAPPVRGGGGMPQRIITVSRSLFSLRITGAGQSGNTPGIGGRLPTYRLITRNRVRIRHELRRQNAHDTHWHCYEVRWLKRPTCNSASILQPLDRWPSPPISVVGSQAGLLPCPSRAVRMERRRRLRPSSTLLTGFSQTLDEMSVVFRAKPRNSVADIHVECRRCAGDGLLQGFLRFCSAPELAQRRRGPAVDHRKMGIRPDQPFRGLDRSLVLAAEISTARKVQQTYCHIRIAGIEPDTRFESRDPFLRPSGENQRRASVAMGDG